MKANIEYLSVPMVCTFEHSKGCAPSLEDPGAPESVGFQSITVGGIEVYPMLTDDQLGEIEALCLKWKRDDDEYQACEHADSLREETRLGGAA
jgi:hypothetical protein